MSISIDSNEGGPIEGLFGSLVEQRVGHREFDQDDEFGHGRRPSEGSDSTRSDTDDRLLGQPSQRQMRPTTRPSIRDWLRNPWVPWRQGPVAGSHSHRTQLGSSHHRASWWNRRLYSRLSHGLMLTTRIAEISPWRLIPDTIGYLRSIISTSIAAIVSSKRRKSWFLSLILISLVLTVFSGGYLLSQLQHHKDLGPPATPIAGIGSDMVLDPGSGPRRDRNRGKKYQSPKKVPNKGNDSPKDPSSGTKTNPGSDGKDESTEVEQHNGSIGGSNSTGIKNQPVKTAPSSSTARICNLEDLASGQWVNIKTQGKAPEWKPDQDLSWTGYGRNGCRSNIWNERYLLTPSVLDNTTTLYGTDLLQADQEHAWHLKNYHWQPDQRRDRQNQRQRQGQPDLGECRLPKFDAEDFVEVLKRAPLVMIGDKFLEQEYLAIECLILGMQNQLLRDYRSEIAGSDVDDKAALNSLEYRIESESPPVVEFKIAPGSDSPPHSESRSSTGASKSRSAIYRKAKPGQMRLVDRISNLTLVTFIRSDVLWDSGMLIGQVAKHALKSTTELSNLDTGGLHPDCKLVGTVPLCEPASISIHDDRSKGSQKVKNTASRWWQWLVGVKDTGLSSNGYDLGGASESEMSVGSDLDRDIINLEWAQSLDDIVKDSAAHREQVSTRRDSTEGDAERKPVVLVSNGHFWEFDPRVAISLTQERSNRKMTKADQDQVKDSQDKRRKLLRQRYTMVMTNMLDYIKANYPDLRVITQTSVRHSACEPASLSTADKAFQDAKEQEAALLNALTKTVVARMQDPLYSFMDTTFLRVFKDSIANNPHCSSFMMPGPLDILVHHLYGELFRLDL
ncbi:hypothetical protein BC939DRAFT_505619 [Gamsiella multidivaricata]|uniref:uncharacterized protein n=1 Tax=Gamsiella multidivaricata TaxID=101098 RepID=UPI002220A113|nr:uncharacterized protein BC939DRAFT_505619 [Gamsiella multidivaricata]KAG0366885.1 hypothetical protein BGZ54_004740 [Gamsiella multidivaricata]KAI7819616.1 hypothetical protein BC939DRAFT_505619 [Gamsiella multidivaricata]